MRDLHSGLLAVDEARSVLRAKFRKPFSAARGIGLPRRCLALGSRELGTGRRLLSGDGDGFALRRAAGAIRLGPRNQIRLQAKLPEPRQLAGELVEVLGALVDAVETPLAVLQLAESLQKRLERVAVRVFEKLAEEVVVVGGA